MMKLSAISFQLFLSMRLRMNWQAFKWHTPFTPKWGVLFGVHWLCHCSFLKLKADRWKLLIHLITILINIVTYLAWLDFTGAPIISSFIIFASGAANNEPVAFTVGFAFVVCWIFARIEMFVQHGDFSFLDNPTIYPPKLFLLIAKCEPVFCSEVLNYRTILKFI